MLVRRSTTSKDADIGWPSSRYTWAGVGVREEALGEAGGAMVLAVIVVVWVELGPWRGAGVSTVNDSRVADGIMRVRESRRAVELGNDEWTRKD